MTTATNNTTTNTNSTDLFASDTFNKSVAANVESAKNLTNKSLVRVSKRTYANSVIRRNSTLTESASIDITLSCVADLSEKVTVQQCVEFCSAELILINRSRFVSHLKKNTFQKENVTILANDVLKFDAVIVNAVAVKLDKKASFKKVDIRNLKTTAKK